MRGFPDFPCYIGSIDGLRAGIATLSLCIFAICPACSIPQNGAPALKVHVGDPGNTRDQELRPEIGDSLSISLSGMPSGEPIELRLLDEKEREWTGARVVADGKGQIAPFMIWYHSGVIGRRPSGLKMDFEPEVAFQSFEEANEFFADQSLRFLVSSIKGEVLLEQNLVLNKSQRPMVYPSDAEGILMNSMHVKEDRMFVTGKNFRPGDKVSIAVVRNQYSWIEGDELIDVTGKEGPDGPESVEVGRDGRFTVAVWDDVRKVPGAFDIIVRVNGDFRDRRLRPDDIVSYDDDTAIVLFAIVNGNVVMDISGRDIPHPGKFEFNDSFEKGEDVWGGVDATDVPSGHLGGAYAAYYVVNHQPPPFWDAVNPPLNDVSGVYEVHKVKYWCLNGTRRMIWGGATQTAPVGEYDVVVDFGSVPAQALADFVPDNTYDKGYDFIDGYDHVGFYVFEDPSSVGPLPTATIDHRDENGISGITDPTGSNGPTYPVDLAWGRIIYPSDGSAGPNPPVNSAQTSYPVAVFLHGRHAYCQTGSGPPASCAIADRVPSHQGYDYIMERLASQGIISVSIDAFDIQLDNGLWNYNARGRLVLSWLDILRDWNNNGTDPFGGILQGKLDMTRIALSGHSRGGEGVVAADVLNPIWPNPQSPNPHNIIAVNAIAPTDQNSQGGISYVPTEAAYYLIIGARDGDVSSMQGLRTYDRAFPPGSANPQHKTLSIIYGANHNFFNTIWTPAADLGSPNPWVGAANDGFGPNPMSAAEQRQAALSTITAFFRRHLQGFEPYKEVLTGRYEPSLIQNDRIYWTYQDAVRVAVDNFEDNPSNAGANSLGGTNNLAGFTAATETHLNSGGTDYVLPPLFPADNLYNHDTIGIKLNWANPAAFDLVLQPGGGGFDASTFTHLNIRVGKRDATGGDVNLVINVQDNGGNSANFDMQSEQWDPIPAQYRASNAMMTGVRIPLRAFTQFSSGVDLSQLTEINISVNGSGEVAVDDVEFTQ